VAVERAGADVVGAQAVAATKSRVLGITLQRNGRSCRTKIATRFARSVTKRENRAVPNKAYQSLRPNN
jgi:hypothetical protein